MTDDRTPMDIYGQKTREREALLGFAKAILDHWPEVGLLDGEDIQDIGVKHGLLIEKSPRPTEPCCESCNCAEYATESEWATGLTCYSRAGFIR